jgi:TolA-binding protein
MIRAVRQIDASHGAKQRLLRRVGWMSLVSVLTSYARDAAAALNAKSLTLLAGLGVAVGVGAYALTAPSPLTPVAHPAPVATPAAPAPPPMAVPDEPTPEEGAESARAEASAATARKTGAPRKAIDPLLGEEIELFDAARTAARNGQAGQALLLLDEYAKSFPSGRFSLEAAALRIESLAATGKHAQARTLAQRFIARHPKSLLVERVRPHAAEP